MRFNVLAGVCQHQATNSGQSVSGRRAGRQYANLATRGFNRVDGVVGVASVTVGSGYGDNRQNG